MAKKKIEKSSQSKGHRHLGRVLDKNQATPVKCETKVLRHFRGGTDRLFLLQGARADALV